MFLIKKRLTIIIILTLSLFTDYLMSASTWLNSSPEEQLSVEGKDDQLGYGRLFIPLMTRKEWEPQCKIYTSENKVISDLNLGESIFLKPGHYRVLFGSATESFDLIQKNFEIKEQETTILSPDWSGLLVTIVNENREKIRSGYEIYHLKSDISLGTKYSTEENDYSDIRSTWILLPGKYKLIKDGEPYNTIKNFTTFELKKGELKEITVVINEETDSYIGSGELTSIEALQSGNDWKSNIYIKGSFDLSGNNSNNKDDAAINLSFKGRINNQTKYDIKPWYLLLKQNLNSGWLQTENDDELRINLDELKLENTVIYYFTSIFGVYTSVDFNTKVFPAREYFSSKIDVQKFDSNGDLIKEEKEVDETITADAGFPMQLSEEIGLNFTILNTSLSNWYIRTGLGFVQNKNNGTYAKTSESSSLITYTEIEDKITTGIIFSSGADLQLSSAINYETTADFLYSLDRNEDFTFDMDNTFKFKFFKYLSLEYTLNLNYDNNSEIDYLIYDNQLALEFSYYLNY